MHEIRCQKTEYKKERQGSNYRKNEKTGQKGSQSALWQKRNRRYKQSEKAAYNAVYNRTTVGVSDITKSSTSSNTSHSVRHSPAIKHEYSDRTYNICGILAMVSGIVLALLGLLLAIAVPVGGIIAIVAGIFFFFVGRKYKKIAMEHAENKNDIEEV